MIYDIVIIGGGPAGMTAGLYAARARHKAIILEGRFIGGQASTTDTLMNYPGFPDGVGGPELMTRFGEHAREAGAELRYIEVIKLDLAGSVKRTYTDDGAVFESHAVILCMGASRRKLGVPGESALIGRGVSYCASCDGALYRGKRVAVVGGGDTAVEDALYLARNSDVILIHRRDRLRAKGIIVEKMMLANNIEQYNSRVVNAIEKTEEGIRLHTENAFGTDLTRIDVAALFVSIGLDPNTSLLSAQIELDAGGYVVAGEDTVTSAAGVFAAGDIRTKSFRQVVTAASDGAVAAYEAGRYIEKL
jgi:thioredoxin reductase (NADPH)